MRVNGVEDIFPFSFSAVRPTLSTVSGERLPMRPITLHVRRDLEDMAPARVLSLLWAGAGRWARPLYESGRLTADVLPVSIVPRNGVEGWPVREVRMTSASGVIRSALVSLDEHGKPLVRVMPPGQATPPQS